MFTKSKGTKKKIFTCLLALCLAGTAFVAGCTGGPSEEPPAEKTVTKIEVTKMPDKVAYNVGEEFSAAGGEITVTYSDSTTEVMAMTAEGVTVSSVQTTINDENKNSDSKTVTVRYGGERVTFEITVSYVMYDFTFDYNYDDKVEVIEVRKDSVVAEPETPTRENYNFDSWYSDEAMTVEYDFDSAITADTTVYAKWLENATYYNVSFNPNYAGSVDPTVQKVKEGDKAVMPAKTPERKGYKFEGWYTSADGTEAYNFESQVVANTTLFAKWTKTAPEGVQEYVFEAEDVNLNGKTGPGLSGTASGVGMIQTTTEHNASNNMFIGYQYEIGCSITFAFISDKAVTDATIVLRLSAEYRDITLDTQSYQISLNGQNLEYNIAFTNVPTPGSAEVDVSKLYALPFEDYVIAENVTLKEGANSIILTTNNDNGLSGTTMTAAAPLIDCLKIKTTAVLDWSARAGLPKDNY